MARVSTRLAAAAAASLLTASAASGQTRARLEAGLGWEWVGSSTLEQVDAAGRRANGQAYRLFTARTRLEPMDAVTGQLGFRLTRGLFVEAAGSFGEATVRTDISGDVEAPGEFAASERLQAFAVTGGLAYHFARARWGGRVVPIIVGGSGYLRELHDRRTLVDAGQVFYAGGGLRIALGRRGNGRVALRGEARARWRRGNSSFDSGSRAAPSLRVLAAVRF